MTSPAAFLRHRLHKWSALRFPVRIAWIGAAATALVIASHIARSLQLTPPSSTTELLRWGQAALSIGWKGLKGLASVAPIATPLIAWKGLSVWRDHEKGKLKQELGRELIYSASSLTQAIIEFRCSSATLSDRTKRLVGLDLNHEEARETAVKHVLEDLDAVDEKTKSFRQAMEKALPFLTSPVLRARCVLLDTYALQLSSDHLQFLRRSHSHRANSDFSDDGMEKLDVPRLDKAGQRKFREELSEVLAKLVQEVGTEAML